MSFSDLFPAKQQTSSPAQLLSSEQLTSVKTVCTFVLLIIAFFFLFKGLGNDALWDDEATTALFAKNVWETGDMSAVVGHNIIAFRSGSELQKLKNRYVPPASYYIAAPFAGLMELNAFSARLPFAICGFLTVVLLAFWMWRDHADMQMWVLMGLGLWGNVSFFLYSRQTRYYALAILLTCILAYLYTHLSSKKRIIWTLSGVSVLLFATNYLVWVGCFAVGCVDYLLWKRRERGLSLTQWGIILIPTALLGGAIARIWNPLGKQVVSEDSSSWLLSKITLLWWNIRDLNAAEFGIGVFILMIPLLVFVTKDQRLLRGFIGLLMFIGVTTLFSPQPVSQTSVADVRYLTPLIPLCIWLGVIVIRKISFNHLWLSVPLALLAFGTNILHGGFLRPEGIRSTVWEYVQEINSHRITPYSAVSDWINQHLTRGESIWVLPDYAMYPLMFHAPQALYAWQLDYPPEQQFEHLPLIHFKGRVPPDYIVAFGPTVISLLQHLKAWEQQGVRYQFLEAIDVYWRDLTRPELFWRTFKPILEFNKQTEGIYVFQYKK